jgi:hypothetical protein
MFRSKLLWLAGLAVVLIVLIVVVKTRPHAKEHADCSPIKNKPELNSMQTRNIASANKTILANMAGYVEFPGDNSYLLLDIDSISAWKPEYHDFRVVTLSGKCVSFQLRVSKTGKDYFYSHPMMFPDHFPSLADKGCEFSNSFSLAIPENERFSCKEIIEHESYSFSPNKRSRRANLVLKSFELEMDGVVVEHEKGNFVKEEWPSS